MAKRMAGKMMEKIKKYVGGIVYISGLVAVVLGVALSGSFDNPSDVIVAGAVAVLVGYCIQGFHRP